MSARPLSLAIATIAFVVSFTAAWALGRDPTTGTQDRLAGSALSADPWPAADELTLGRAPALPAAEPAARRVVETNARHATKRPRPAAAQSAQPTGGASQPVVSPRPAPQPVAPPTLTRPRRPAPQPVARPRPPAARPAPVFDSSGTTTTFDSSG